jgi:hypothetical protein
MTIAEHIAQRRKHFTALTAAGVVLVLAAGVVFEVSLDLELFRVIGWLGLVLMLVSWAYGYLVMRCPICRQSLISPMWIGPPFLPNYTSCPRCKTDFALPMPGAP